MSEVDAVDVTETVADIEEQLEDVERVIEAVQDKLAEAKVAFEECIDLDEGEEPDSERLQAIESQLSDIASNVSEPW